MAHGNNTISIPGELRSEATEGVVASADAIKDYKKGKFQEQVNEEVSTEINNIKDGSTDSIASLKTAINNEKSRAQNAESDLQSSINTEKNRAKEAESNLQNAVNAEKSRAEGVEATKANASDVYTKAQGTAFEGEVNNAISQQNTNIANKFAQQDAAINGKFNQQDQVIDERLDAQDEKIDTLEKQDVEVVEDHEAVENPDPKTIYREPSEDKTSYTDWMYQDGWIELATHSFPGIDNEPTEDSPNIVNSGGLAAVYGSYKESPEFIKVELDEEDKVLEGIRNDGTKVIGGDLLVDGDVKVIGETEIGGVSYKVIGNPEWIRVVVDSENKILCGIRQNGKFYADIDGIDEQVKELIQPLMDDVEELVNRFDEIFKFVENPEFISIELDAEDKVLGGRKIDGTRFENVGLYLGGTLLEGVKDPENRMEIKTDSEKRIISYRKEDGTLVENAGVEASVIKTDSLKLTKNGMREFQQALKDSGFNPGGEGDFSEKKVVELPEPKQYGVLNLIVPILPVNNTEVSNGYAEYYDFGGNYWKKPVVIEPQGQTSRVFAMTGGKGNYTLNIDDGSEIKFGSWVPQDSFHLKGNAKDVTRGYLATSYKLAYIMMEYMDAKPNRVLSKENKITEMCATGDRFSDWPDDARCLPDGFPVEVYLNGEYYGLFALQLKKHRKNYSMNKNDYTSFFIDADNLMPDGYQSGFWLGDIPWTEFEIKNPKELVCMDGSKYNGDFPKELIDNTSEFYDPSNKVHKGSATTKEIIKSFSTKFLEVKALVDANTDDSIAEAKTKFAEYFDLKSCIFVYIYNCLMKNADSIAKNTLWATYKNGKIAPMLWDLDGMYGQGWRGNSVISPSAYLWESDYATAAWPLSLLWRLYKTEIKETYINLRENGIISMDTWKEVVLNNWINRIGSGAYDRDIKRWPETPSYRKNFVNSEYWEEFDTVSNVDGIGIWNKDTSYNIGDKVAIDMMPESYAAIGSRGYVIYKAVQSNVNVCPVTEFYTEFPTVGGVYDSPKRMKKWIQEQIRLCDSLIGYNNN